MTALYQNRQIRDLESFVISNGLNDEKGLMHNAATAVLDVVQKYFSEAQHFAVCCGKGNNAGDGYVLARLLHQAGKKVDIYALSELDQLKGAALDAAKAGLDAGLNYIKYEPNIVFHADVIIDALLGTGLKGDIEGIFADAIAAINASENPVIAIDAPSGINVDNGAMHGCAVQADITVTFIAYKQGLFTHQAPAYCGDIILDNIGVPKEAFDHINKTAELLEWSELKSLLPRRKKNTHKGDYGHVLVIGGDYGMGGAVRMAAEAAMRVGAGLVSVATRPEHVPIVSGSRPEIMCHQVGNAEDLQVLLQRASVVVIGPGLGKSDWAKELLQCVLTSELAKVLDADALNLLSQSPSTSKNWVLTPHPGEASRLLDITCQQVQLNRFETVQQIQQKYGGVVILKGVGTIIKNAQELPHVCQAGNPGMATGGMGDILSGVIGGLLAQKLTLEHAAELGVLVHAMAADKAAERDGERGLLATDLLCHLRQLVNPVK